MKDKKEIDRIRAKKRYDNMTSEERIKYNARKNNYRKNMSKEQKKKLSRGCKLSKRAYHLMKTYGITIDQYNILFLKQEGKCLICGKHQQELKMTLRVDHDHNTGKTRGLLCHSCNTAIGLMEENIDTLTKAVQYLKSTKDECSMKSTL